MLLYDFRMPRNQSRGGFLGTVAAAAVVAVVAVATVGIFCEFMRLLIQSTSSLVHFF